jgi:hypothetical protein
LKEGRIENVAGLGLGLEVEVPRRAGTERRLWGKGRVVVWGMGLMP